MNTTIKKKLFYVAALCIFLNINQNADAVGVSNNKLDLTTPTINNIKAEGATLTAPTPYQLYPATGTLPTGAVEVMIGSDKYYFVMNASDDKLFKIIASTPAKNLIASPTGSFEVNGNRYDFDVNAIPDSTYSLRELTGTQTSAFSITKYLETTDTSGNKTFTPVKYAVEFTTPLGEPTGTLPLHYKWLTESDGTKFLVATDTPTEANITYNMKTTYGDDLTVGVNPDPVTKYYKWGIDASGNRFLEDGTDVDHHFVASSKDHGRIVRYTGNHGSISNSFIGNSHSATNAYGAGIYNSGTLDNVTGDFVGNSASGTLAYGGAIFNYRGTIENITGDFIGNRTSSDKSNAFGGAIYNTGTITNITGDFVGNYAVTSAGTTAYSSPSGLGGAIYNTGTITNITGDFIDNYATSQGAGVWNIGTIDYITGNFIGNNIKTLHGYGGGAIYNKGTINNIIGDFIGNTAEVRLLSSGGAMRNESGTIGNIVGNFIGNSIQVETQLSYGGAIRNINAGSKGASIGSITGDFIGNYAKSGGADASGGAIRTTGSTIGTIVGDFSDNYALSVTNHATGGAIYNDGAIASITGSFTNNYTEAKTYTMGGAVYNGGTITIDGDFLRNYTSGATSSFGGAVYNTGTITTNGDFIGNYTSGATSYGGAIYNDRGTISNITGLLKDNGKNSTGVVSTHLGGAIYNNGGTSASHTANLTIANSKFESNASTLRGGALYNTNLYGSSTRASSTNLEITGSTFTNNQATVGGAIYNDSNKGVIDINADFILNSARSTTGSKGGAIYNTKNGVIGNLSGNFEGNFTQGSAVGSISDGDKGGAIYNEGTINITSGIFKDNGTRNTDGSVASDYGGAIYNSGTISLNGGTFSENHAVEEGGAIYNSGTMTVTDADFINNKITPTSGASNQGGAIYNTGTFSLNAAAKDVLLEGNVAGTNNAIHNKGTLDINANGGRRVALKDGVTGENGVINLNSDTSATGMLQIFGAISDNTINFSKGLIKLESGATLDKLHSQGSIASGVQREISTMNGAINTYSLNEMNIENTKLSVDMNLNSTTFTPDGSTMIGQSDKFSVTNAPTVNSGLVWINLLDIGSINGAGRVQVFTGTQEHTENISLLSGAVNIISGAGAVNLTHDSVDRGWFEYGVTLDSHNLNQAVDFLQVMPSDQTQYIMGDSGNETVHNNIVGYQPDPLELVHSSKHMAVNGFTKGGASGYTVTSSEVDSLGAIVDATLTLIDDANGKDSSSYTSSNINYDRVNFDMQGSNNIVSFENREDRVATNLDSDFTSSNQANKLIMQGDGLFNLNGTADNLTFDVNSTVNTAGEISNSTINVNGIMNGNSQITNSKVNINGILNKNTYDSKTTYQLNEGGNLNFTDIKFLYDPTRHGADLALNSINFNGGAMNSLQNNSIDTVKLDNIAILSNTNLSLDVDLAGERMDTIDSNTVSLSSGASLNIDKINLISDAAKDATIISFTNTQNLAGAIKYTGANPIAYSPIYRYDVTYDAINGDFLFERGAGGYDTYNPSIMAGPVGAQVGGYLTQLQVLEESFSNMDMVMLMPKSQRIMYLNANKTALADSKLGTTQEGKVISEQNNGIWARPYTSFENVGLSGGPKVGNIMYGTMLGGESKILDLKNGWSAINSAYAAYNGSHQTYDGIGIYQNGGHIGAGTSLYKDNYFVGLTTNVGMSTGRANTFYGSENFNMLMSGAGLKTGYNFEFADGKFIIQPNYTMGYSFVNTFDYTNASGNSITSNALHALQIAPGVRFVGNLKDGWQPYGSIQMMWNLMDETDFTANLTALPQLSVDPYVQYGLGLQKRSGDNFTGFGQVMLRNGGRNSVSLQFGFRWAVGKEHKDSL